MTAHGSHRRPGQGAPTQSSARPTRPANLGNAQLKHQVAQTDGAFDYCVNESARGGDNQHTLDPSSSQQYVKSPRRSTSRDENRRTMKCGLFNPAGR